MARVAGPTGRFPNYEAPDPGTLVRVRSSASGPLASSFWNHDHGQRRRVTLTIPYLRNGSTGPIVKKLQALLNRHGANLAVDGLFGPLTRDAVIAYQRSAELKVDGIAGLRTLTRLNHDVYAAHTATTGGSLPTAGQQVTSSGSALGPAKAAFAFPEAPAGLQSASIHDWPPEKVIATVLLRTGSKLPEDLRAQWIALISPSSIAFIVGSILILAVGQALGYGEVADAALLGVAIYYVGISAFRGVEEFVAFLVSVTRASTEKDLDIAASHLAEAIVLLGIAAITALLLKRGIAKKKSPPIIRARVRPINGTVNVGGTGTALEGVGPCTNLNPLKPGSGGATIDIPNLIKAGFEEIGEIFEPGSVQRLVSRRLRFGDVNWQQAVSGTKRVMAPGGQLELNVWTSGPAEVETLINSFRGAGFDNVRNMTGLDGPGTIITGTWPQ
jgi:peptidoglycan hydrolase-like protein with peptidoglycan-binding domain